MPRKISASNGFLAESLKRRGNRRSLLGYRIGHKKPLEWSITTKAYVQRFIALFGRTKWSYSLAHRVKETMLQEGCDEIIVQQLLLTWAKLFLASTCFKEFSDFYQLLFRECLDREGQALYSDAMDLAVQQRVDGDKPSSMGLSIARTEPHRTLYLECLKVDPKFWMPMSIFPLWEFSKPPKTMSLGFLPYDGAHEDEFRVLVATFLKKYAPNKIFLPSPIATLKVGGSKYNDGGEVRHDSEKPENAWDSGFLFQEFLTGPLTPREVWLPGKLLKANNAYWFSVISQIIKNVPYYANRFHTPQELWDSIKSRLNGNRIHFDVSGFGLQYPRPLLRIIVEEILKRYPDTEFEDVCKTTLRYLTDVELQVGDKFVYPTRGIGLGYYESMKTIGVMAILDILNPISIFGDQGIIDTQEAIKHKAHPVALLKKFGFIFTASDKVRMEMIKDDSPTLFAGCLMSGAAFERRKCVFAGLSGALSKEFHWERKDALIGLQDDLSAWPHMWKRIAFQYELLFGYEFEKGDSMRHPENLGVCVTTPRVVGMLKDWKVAKLARPGIEWKDGLLYVQPFGEPVHQSEAKAFSLLRKAVWKSSTPFDTAHRDYVYPIVKLNKKHSPLLSKEAQATPFWMDARNLILKGKTTRRVCAGLDEEGTSLAPFRQRFASDPYEARATGGYTILTDWRTRRGASAEMEILSDFINSASDISTRYVFSDDYMGKIPLSYLWQAKTTEESDRILRSNPRTRYLFAEAQRQADVEKTEAMLAEESDSDSEPLEQVESPPPSPGMGPITPEDADGDVTLDGLEMAMFEDYLFADEVAQETEDSPVEEEYLESIEDAIYADSIFYGRKDSEPERLYGFII